MCLCREVTWKKISHLILYFIFSTYTLFLPSVHVLQPAKTPLGSIFQSDVYHSFPAMVFLPHLVSKPCRVPAEGESWFSSDVLLSSCFPTCSWCQLVFIRALQFHLHLFWLNSPDRQSSSALWKLLPPNNLIKEPSGNLSKFRYVLFDFLYEGMRNRTATIWELEAKMLFKLRNCRSLLLTLSSAPVPLW